MRATWRSRWRFLVAGGVVVALAVAGASLVQRKKAALNAAPRYGLGPIPVRVATARRGDLERTHDYWAVVEPRYVAKLAARITSTVQEVRVWEGDLVRAGEILIILDGEELRQSIGAVAAQVKQASAERAANEATVEALRSNLAYWTREAERVRRLFAEGAANAVEADTTEDRLNEARSNLEAAQHKSRAIELQMEALESRRAELQTQLGYCTITSPYDGIVSARHVDPGDQAAPGQPLLVIEDRGQMKLVFDVPQQDLSEVHAGLKLRYRTGRGWRDAVLTKLYPSLNDARMVRAEAILSGEQAEGLATGAYLQVSVELERLRDVTTLPKAAIVESPTGKTHVFVVESGHLVTTPVRLLATRGDEVAVEGLPPDQQVVVSTFLGWAQLSSGIKVEAVE